MVDFRLRVRKIKSGEGGKPRFVIEKREIKNPRTMVLGESEQLSESELRTRLTEWGLTPQEISSEIEKAIE